MHEYKFSYRLAKELNMAHDRENNPAEAFAQLAIETEEPISDEKLKEDHETNFREYLARQAKMSPSYIIPITNEEYDIEHEYEGYDTESEEEV